MFGGLPFWLVPEEWKEREREAQRKAAEAGKRYFEEVLVPNAVDWDPNFGKKGLNDQKKVCFKASTFKTEQEPLFCLDVKPCHLTPQNLRQPHENDIVGPTVEHAGKENTWIYRHAILPRGEDLWLRFGNAKGTCYFDGDVVFSVLYQYRPWHWERKFLVWMSISPMEMISQRSGIKHCSGRVCIGGHGMGWFLEQVAAKRSVKSIVVVEKSIELLDWFARDQVKRIAEETGKPIEIVQADVFPYLQEHHEDFDKIALDVFKTYGNNNTEDDVRIADLLFINPDPRRPWKRKPRFDRKKLWCWGSVKIGQQERIRYI